MPRQPTSAPRRAPGRPSAAEATDAREALLEATGKLVARSGAGAVSLRRIAEEAGVSAAMVHYYFGDKEGLYDAMLDRTFSRLVARVREAVAGDADDEARDPLADLLEVLTHTWAHEPWVVGLLVREVLAEGGHFRERFIRSYASQMAQLLPGLMRREIERGRFRRELEPELAFLSFMGMTLFPFVARPVVEGALGIDYDEAFLARFTAHTRRLFLEGAGA